MCNAAALRSKSGVGLLLGREKWLNACRWLVIDRVVLCSKCKCALFLRVSGLRFLRVLLLRIDCYRHNRNTLIASMAHARLSVAIIRFPA